MAVACYLIDDIEGFRQNVVGTVIVGVDVRTSAAGPQDPGYWEEVLITLDSGYVIHFSSTFSEDFKQKHHMAQPSRGADSGYH
ncbi:MAG: hypothetical protein NUW12_02790 [Firmicutes bacterium]|jgi:hypothetical protein|nr:hypothetical protein [Bacillota bacterium]MDH7495110.1 hypothetical protein [Bacillota bacterium]